MPGRNFKSRPKDHEERLLRFADGLAEEKSITGAAESIGQSSLWGWKAFNEVCKRLGRQAE
jgi:hypothetical protein